MFYKIVICKFNAFSKSLFDAMKYAASVLFVFALTSVALFAGESGEASSSGQSISIDSSLINWSGLSTSILSAITVPIAAAIGIGLSVALVMWAYRIFRWKAM
ncbi:MAG: hypothetical protein LBE13_02120 [Bacteroidales bacterium]|jgi:hypothetical protein|nr:hypothetical protein [Bacteroidales bacterium]